LRKVANRQTNKQRRLHILLGGGNKPRISRCGRINDIIGRYAIAEMHTLQRNRRRVTVVWRLYVDFRRLLITEWSH